MDEKTVKPRSGFIYAILSLIFAIVLPTGYGLYVAAEAFQEFISPEISANYDSFEEYLLESFSSPTFIIFTQVLLWLGMLIGPLLAALRKVRHWADDTKVLALGFRTKWLWLGVLLGLGAQAVLLTFGALIQSAYPDNGLEGNATEIAEMLAGLNVITMLLLIVVGAPIVEELLYRGLVFTALSNKIGVIAGGVISSLIFGFSHVTSLSINGIFTGVITSLFGGLLVYARLKSKGLTLPIVMHIAFNGVSGVALLVAGSLV